MRTLCAAPGTPSPAAPGPAVAAAGPSPAASTSAASGPARTRGRRSAGQASLEYLGMLPFLLLIALAGIQLGIAAYCGSQAGTAARTAARTAALPGAEGGQGPGRTAGENAVSGWVDPDISFPVDSDATVTAEATVRIPSVLPGVHLFGPVHRDATMPKEDWTP